MECKLGTVVEGHRLPSLEVQLTEHLGHSLGDGSGGLASGSEAYENAGVAFVHG